MTHAEFVRAYREGSIQVEVDRAAAARLVSGRMLLPFILLPVLGLGVALALVGYVIAGVLVFLAGLGLRLLVRSSSHSFVLSRSLHEPAFYEEMVKNDVLLLRAR
jgi:hypothetical protein